MWLAVASGVLYVLGAAAVLTGVGAVAAPALFIAAGAVGAASVAADCTANWGGDQTGCVVGVATVGVGVGVLRGPVSAAARALTGARAVNGIVRDAARSVTWVGGIYGTASTTEYAYGRISG